MKPIYLYMGVVITFVLAVSVAAEDSWTPVADPSLGELTLSVREVAGVEVPGSYVLRYHNFAQPGQMDGSGTFVTDDGDVHWRIERLPNAQCILNDMPSHTCADTVYVFPPDGYISVPDTATMDEGSYTEILIIPNTMG